MYCRKLHAATHIVSRITHTDNRKPVFRAGADFALSYGMLAVQTLISAICQRALVVIGDATELFIEPVPPHFHGTPLTATNIEPTTGLLVIGIRSGAGGGVARVGDGGGDGGVGDGARVTADGDSRGWRANPAPETVLAAGDELVMIGSSEQRRAFLALGGDA